MASLIDVQVEIDKTGFHPGQLEADGKIHRFKKDADDKGKSGWYLCHQNHSDKGEVFYVAIWADWRDPHGQEYKFITSFTQTKGDRAKIEAQLEAAERRRRAEQERVWEETSKTCTIEWETLPENPECEYLRAKKIPSLYGCRSNINPQAGERAVYVPVRDLTGKLWGWQKVTTQGKFFEAGTKKSGNFHIVGGAIEHEDIVYLAEGFATASSIHQALGKPVVVCFDAGNLAPVAEAIRATYKEKRFVVCGDDDQFTESGNAGREKAEAAAKTVLGKAVFPVFKENAERWTDFNDLHLAEGLEIVKAQISGINPETYRILTLGHLGENYFYISSSNQQIVTISRGNHGKAALLDLMPKAFWESQYPTKMGIDWDSASSDLMEACRRAGVFQPDRIRGVGVWREPKQRTAVVNVGNAVWVDGRMQPLNSFPSKYTYEIGNKIKPPHDSPLSVEECKSMVEALQILRWKKPDFAKFMAGWLVMAPLAGALQWRAHIWLVGPSGSGKSFFLQHFVNRLFGSNRFFFQGNTTEAGIRQTIGADARPVLFDEFETDDEKTAERIQTILELIRQASSESDGFVVKGGSGGKAVQYRIRFCALVGSVRLNLEREQDKNRFTILDLERPGADKSEHLARLKKAMLPLSEEYGNRLFSRMVRMLPVILENRDLFHVELSDRYNPRFGQQYGMLMAGYAALISDRVLSGDEVSAMVRELDLNEESEVVQERDESECWDFLMKKVVTADLLTYGKNDRSIGELIHEARFSTEAPIFQAALARIGIKIEEGYVFIANSHPSLRALFRGTKWVTGWRKPLSRIDGVKLTNTKRFGPVTSKCVGVPISSL